MITFLEMHNAIGKKAQLALIVFMVCMGGTFTVVRPFQDSVRAQSNDTLIDRNRMMITAVDDELSELHDQQLHMRLTLVEESMLEVKWLGRTVATVLLTQLVLMVTSRRKRT